MKVEVKSREELSITPSNATEAAQLHKTHKQIDPYADPIGYAEAISELHPIILKPGKRTLAEGGGWVEVEICEPLLDPYESELYKNTGWFLSDHETTPELAEAILQAIGQSLATRHIISLEVCGTMVTVRAAVCTYGKSEAHDDIAREEYGRKRLRQSMLDKFWRRPPTPQFLQRSNGSYYRNPKYATAHREPIQKVADDHKIREALWNYWKDNGASEAQKEIIGKAVGSVFSPYSHFSGIYHHCPGGTVNWDNKGTEVAHMKAEEFAALA